jgi:hypothetical protein
MIVPRDLSEASVVKFCQKAVAFALYNRNISLTKTHRLIRCRLNENKHFKMTFSVKASAYVG